MARYEDETIQLPLQRRVMDFSGVNVQERLVHFSFSSDQEIPRKFGREILSHKSGALNTERLDRQAVPFLVDHNFEKQAGKIVNYQLGRGKNYATAKLFRSPLGDLLLSEIQDGRTEISCGYLIHEMQLTEETPGQQDNLYTVVNYEIIEISSVSVPADITVGIGRGLDEQLYATRVLSPPNQESMLPPSETSAFKTRENASPRLIKTVEESYSLSRILSMGQEVDGFEREVHRALQKEKGFDAHGIMGTLVPFEALISKRSSPPDLSITGSASSGGSMVESSVWPTIADTIRPYSAVAKAGAQILSGLTGNFIYPRRWTSSTPAWQASENAEPSKSGPTFSTLTLTPLRLTTYSVVSKQLLIQARDRSVEDFLKQSILRDISAAIDNAALNGPGPGTNASGPPLGLLAQAENTSGPPYDLNKLAAGLAFGSGAATWTSVIAMKYAVEKADYIDDGTMAYITSPLVKRVLSNTPVIPANPNKFIWDTATDTIAGKRAVATSNMSTNQLLFGQFASYAICLWALDCFADNFTFASSNMCRLVITALANVGTLQGPAFCRSEDSAAGP